MIRFDQIVPFYYVFSKVGLVSKYSKLSIKRPVLSNDLVWIFLKKSLLNDQVHFRKKWSYYFISWHSQFLGFIKRPGLDIWKKSLLNDQHYLFFKF